MKASKPHPNPVSRGFCPGLTRNAQSWLCLVSLLVGLVGTLDISAQITNAPVQTNDVMQADDAAASDTSQAGDVVSDEDATGTNSVPGTNQIATPGPDGRTRRRQRRRPLTRSTDNSPDSRMSSALTNGAAGSLDYSAFQLVAERNIFDPNRAPRTRVAAQPKTTDSFTLVGTMSYEKGIFAFFDGTSSDYKKALKPQDTIAGYKVVAISSDSVKLMLNTNTLELTVGNQMRRREDGSWEKSAGSASYASASTNASAPESAPSGAESDVIKKMMMRREKE
jgi:hypothetical protein